LAEINSKNLERTRTLHAPVRRGPRKSQKNGALLQRRDEATCVRGRKTKRRQRGNWGLFPNTESPTRKGKRNERGKLPAHRKVKLVRKIGTVGLQLVGGWPAEKFPSESKRPRPGKVTSGYRKNLIYTSEGDRTSRGKGVSRCKAHAAFQAWRNVECARRGFWRGESGGDDQARKGHLIESAKPPNHERKKMPNEKSTAISNGKK